MPADRRAWAGATAAAVYAVGAAYSDQSAIVVMAAANTARRLAGGSAGRVSEDPFLAERAAQAGLLSCVVGNPFRPATLDPRWLTPTVLGLARGIDEERAFDRLPVLADALEDAGCGEEGVLNHCRRDATHGRGCWVVGGILGRE